MQMQMAMDGYQWGVELDAAEFEPDIPEDYELMSLKMPKRNVESAIEGLKKFVELVGRYPKELSNMGLSREMTEAMTKKMQAEREKRKAELLTSHPTPGVRADGSVLRLRSILRLRLSGA